jgi:photosystem II stability/assembly factor-like uncharacterized protein
MQIRVMTNPLLPIIKRNIMKIIYTIILLLLLASTFVKAQWQQINSGLPGNSVYGLATDGQYIYSGSSIAGVYRSSNKGTSWTNANNGLPVSNAWELYSNNDTLFVGFFGPGAFRSTDHGNTWDTLTVGTLNSSVRGFISNDKYLFAATWGNGVFRSSDGGDNWSEINNGLNYLTFWDIISFGDTLLAANNGGGIYRSTNNGNSWSQSNTGITSLIAYRLTTSGNYIFVGTSNSGVFRSSDFGINWEQVGSPSLTIWALLAYDTLLFAGTINSGVFISSDYGNTWETFNQGNPIGSIVELMYDSTYVYAATLGGGVYRYDKNSITSVENISRVIPTSFELKQNYPNPFNPSTKISWQSPVSAHQTLKVYDILGNDVATLVNEYRAAGSYEVDFHPASSIKNLVSGVYFYSLQVGSFVETKKMILLK